MILTLRCPAKVNLFLSVGPKDEKNFHPLRTVFQAVSLFDVLTISTKATKTEIFCEGFDLPKENTLTRTLNYVSELVPIPPLRIHLRKNIPSEAGLGGGSSDAAGLLRALQKILSAPLNKDQIFDMAAAIGKDVPFFLLGGRAKAEGYGELLTPIRDDSALWMVIAQPKTKVSTLKAYMALDAKERKWSTFPEEMNEFYNDFEQVAPAACIKLKTEFLKFGAKEALLCGSGSAVFGIFDGFYVAEQVAMQLVQQGYPFCKVVHSLTQKESLWTLLF